MLFRSAESITREIAVGGLLSEQNAATISQMVNIIAMALFCTSRFVCTFFLRYISAGKLLMVLSIVAGCAVVGVITSTDIKGMYFLIAVSACMSLMFPTIYGIALEGMGDDAKFGAAGLIMSILGGSVLTPVQGSIIDLGSSGDICLGLPYVNVSFILPFICFVVIAVYGFRVAYKMKSEK